MTCITCESYVFTCQVPGEYVPRVLAIVPTLGSVLDYDYLVTEVSLPQSSTGKRTTMGVGRFSDRDDYLRFLDHRFIGWPPKMLAEVADKLIELARSR